VNASLIMNEIQPFKVVKEALRLTKKYNGVKRQHKALVIGVTYKPNIADVRETPAIPIVKELEKRDVQVSFYDPYVTEFLGKQSIQFTQEEFEKFDIMILLTAHKTINYEKIVASGIPILDTRNALFEYHAEQIYNLFMKKQKDTTSEENEIIGNYFLL
jgi:UDP-N-acetyl-D-glucosamine dehydrogenase